LILQSVNIIDVTIALDFMTLLKRYYTKLDSMALVYC